MERQHTPRQKDQFKRRLKKIIGTKFNTVMIFPLAKFEESFGFLWGLGKQEDELTEDEKIYKEMYENVRNSILDNGNKNKRNAFAEIDLHDVAFNGYITNFVVNGNKKD